MLPYAFAPEFSNTTYNTISWPTISQSTVGVTLSPASGYLPNVVSGGDFSFTLSGGGADLVDKVYANSNEFTAGGNEQGGTTYTYNANTGVYTIKNVTANQVITLTLKEIGITVNGEDISAINGAGWAYDAAAQTLTLSRPNLTVSGSNDPAMVPNFSIAASGSATSVSFSSLNFNGKSVRFEAQETTLSLAGSNRITSKDTAAPGCCKPRAASPSGATAALRWSWSGLKRIRMPGAYTRCIPGGR